MVNIHISYEGELHCRLTHEPSKRELTTDAPKDNMGKGESFSPTDLVASALGSCFLTTMAIYAQRHGIELKGAQAHVTKEMTASPDRRIARLTVRIDMPKGIGKEQRPVLEKVALTCPVHKSLDHSVKIPISFKYPD